MAHSRPIPRASLSRSVHPSRLPRDHFLTRPGSHLFSGWPRATIRDLSIVLLLRRISPYTFRISPKPPSLRPSPTYRVSAPSPSLLPPLSSSTVSPPRRSSRRTDIPSRTMSIYPPSGMILHPGAHFGDSPTPDSGESRAPLGATPNREPAVGAPLSGCFQSRVHWPALTLRHRHPVVRRHLHTACVSRMRLSYPPPRIASSRTGWRERTGKKERQWETRFAAARRRDSRDEEGVEI